MGLGTFFAGTIVLCADVLGGETKLVSFRAEETGVTIGGDGFGVC